MTRRPRIDRPSFDVDRQKGRGRLGDLYKLLVTRHRQNGDSDPDGRARLDVERLLAAAFDDLARHYQGGKKRALDDLVRLQGEALDFYDGVLVSKGSVNVAHLENILKDMDRCFRDLARKADDVAAEMPPLSRVETYDPRTRLTTVEYSGGAEAGGATYLVTSPEIGTVEATVSMEGPHPGRRKGHLPDPVGGLVPGEHRGHMGPEGAVADPRVTNVVENLISEAEHSNLSPKKKFDNLITKVAVALPDRVKSRSRPQRSDPNSPRPDYMIHEIVVDGQVVYRVVIPNE